MEINGLKVLEGRLNDLNLKDFLNPKFSELLEKELDNPVVIHLGIAVGAGEDQKLLSLAHTRREHAENNELTIKVPHEDQMDQILNVIKLFGKEE